MPRYNLKSWLLSILFTAIACAAGNSAAMANPTPPSEQPLEKQWQLCSSEALTRERETPIPKGLLQSIALAESGRWHDERRENFAWPWTVTAEGKGQFFPTQAAAISHVRDLTERGVRNIDVGCMQVNLMYHPDAFTSLENAFNPIANVGYAADLLQSHFKTSGSWLKAAGSYHSNTPKFNGPYRKKITRLWSELNAAERRSQLADAAAGAKPVSKREKWTIVPIDHTRMNKLNQRFRERRFQQLGGEAPRAINMPERTPTPQAAQHATQTLQEGEVMRTRLDDWREQQVANLTPTHQKNLLEAQSRSTRFAQIRREQLRTWRETGNLPRTR